MKKSHRLKRIFFIVFTIFILCCFCSCGGTSPSDEPPSGGSPPSVETPKDSSKEKGSWNVDVAIRTPSADQTVVYGCDIVTIDASNTNQGYLMVQYIGSNPKVKMQLTGSDSITYTYNLSSNMDTFPLTSGNGTYNISIYENISDTKYALAFSQDIEVSIEDPLLPFLYPNQYVWYTANSNAVSYVRELAYSANSDLDVVQIVYDYIINNFKYDYDKAETVQPGYLPDVDSVLSSKTGICFDYASLMATMLRSQGIPVRLEVGYCGEEYHAWISVYLKDKGWVNGIIEMKNNEWTLMDPTFASTSKDPQKFITENDTYLTKYIY